ncbi:MAG TPA: T9SS type A sorting domain-containing protein [Ignavibacteria bacterium]|nr:T9SS type A sorting domain-containing protein [Ignavibacteria bacterium]
MKKILTFLIFMLFGISLSYSQNSIHTGNDHTGCFPGGLDKHLSGFNFTIQGSSNKLRGGADFNGAMVHKTPEPGQFLRVLILYVRFPDDNLGGNVMGGYAVWNDPLMPKPVNPYTSNGRFIDTAEVPPTKNFTERYTEYTISDYFSEMSLGTFDVIGDEYSIMLPQTSVEYRELGYSCSQINAIAIKQAEQQYNLDMRRYNNWSFTPEGWVWMPGSGDNTADMIVMVYRHAPEYPAVNWFINASIPVSGISDLGLASTFVLDSTFITGNSGVTCLSLLQNYSKMTQIMLHEMSHRYFFNHYEIGLMTGVEHSSFNYSPFERTYIGYIDPPLVRYPYQGVSETFTLGDYVHTGDLLAIELPESNELYYIANHQKRSMYDGISRGSTKCWEINKVQQDPYCPEGKGLYIYHQMHPSRCNEFKDVYLVQADGKYDWYIDRMVPYFDPFYNFEIPLYEKLEGNTRGRSEFHQRLDSILPNMQEVTDDPCSDKTDDYFVTYDWLGDGKDAFNMGYDEILSPYSNPPSNTCNGTASGLTMKLLGQDSLTGAITFRLYYNDAAALSDLPPAKPKNLKVTKNITEPVSGKFFPELKWDKNREPDFLGKPGIQGIYNIYRGIFTACSPDSMPQFLLVGSVHADSNTFIDSSIALYPEGGGSVGCADLFRSLNYRIEAVDITGLASLHSDRAIINGYTQWCDDSVLTGISHNQLPVKFSVFNYPNPFNPSTKISYSLPRDAFVTLKIYSITGQEVYRAVNNEFRLAGHYSVNFDGTNLPSGVYFYVYRAGDFTESKKMVLVK